MIARNAAEARALDARNADLAWQVVTALVQLFGGKDAKGPEREAYLDAAGVARHVADKAEKMRLEREHAIRVSRKFDRFLKKGKRARTSRDLGKSHRKTSVRSA